MIQTVGGVMEVAALTFCQSHEHLAIRPGQSAKVNPALCIDEPSRTARELTEFRAAGGSTVVDAQPTGCGRDAAVLAALAAETGVQIIASTGFHKRCFYPEGHWLFRWEKAQLAELFAGEIREGMFLDGDGEEPQERSGIRAGQIKTALEAVFDGLSEKLFSAAAQAAQETGAALMIHTDPGADAPALLEFLEGLGVPPQRQIFCHLDRTCADLAVHRRIAARGAYLEYDTIGRFKYHSDEAEAAIFREMIEAGYESRLLFSLDTTRERLRSYTPEGVGLTYILEQFLPRLRAEGIGETSLEKICRDNAREAFSMEAGNKE